MFAAAHQMKTSLHAAREIPRPGSGSAQNLLDGCFRAFPDGSAPGGSTTDVPNANAAQSQTDTGAQMRDCASFKNSRDYWVSQRLNSLGSSPYTSNRLTSANLLWVEWRQKSIITEDRAERLLGRKRTRQRPKVPVTM
ncbi:hypothetical protein GCM10011507_27480 [Edaphobacter acidisoli]|uniref:Uncharacterized protein n=1 Tax=Edaphobacter acidisoli TaxID=2040573 RepID=A0A916RX62_9BACT|nr:hypothetical protein GCM10011507_27480 [Edaphobacter acidisoli]